MASFYAKRGDFDTAIQDGATLIAETRGLDWGAGGAGHHEGCVPSDRDHHLDCLMHLLEVGSDGPVCSSSSLLILSPSSLLLPSSFSSSVPIDLFAHYRSQAWQDAKKACEAIDEWSKMMGVRRAWIGRWIHDDQWRWRYGGWGTRNGGGHQCGHDQ